MNKKNISGIYCITNITNDKKYIGSSKSVYYRWKQGHLPQLRKNKHGNQHLQNAWNKYGQEQFEFSILEECSKSQLQEKEGFWIEKYKSWHRSNGYNLERIINGRITRHDYELHESIIRLFKKGTSKLGIAKKLNISRTLIYHCLELNGLHNNTGKGKEIKLTDKIKEKIKILREQDKTWDEIIEKVGVSKTQLVRKNIIFGDDKFIHPTRTSYETITKEKINQLYKLIEEGKTWCEIENKLGVSRNAFWAKGIKPKSKKRKKPVEMTKEKKEEIQHLRKQGKTWKEICATTKVSYTNIRKYKLHK